eukprot:scaffold24016_cov117-Cylindrotheca_fusiformis.AAC.2
MASRCAPSVFSSNMNTCWGSRADGQAMKPSSKLTSNNTMVVHWIWQSCSPDIAVSHRFHLEMASRVQFYQEHDRCSPTI